MGKFFSTILQLLAQAWLFLGKVIPTTFTFPSKLNLRRTTSIGVLVISAVLELALFFSFGSDAKQEGPNSVEKNSIVEVFQGTVSILGGQLEGDFNSDGSPDLAIPVKVLDLPQAGKWAIVQDPWAEASDCRTENLDQSERCRFHALLVLESGKTPQRYLLLCAAWGQMEVLRGLRVVSGRSCEEFRTVDTIFEKDVILSREEGGAGGIIYRCALGYCWRQWGD